MKAHVAFSFDVRFYSINARAATATDPGHEKMRRLVLNAGLSFK